MAFGFDTISPVSPVILTRGFGGFNNQVTVKCFVFGGHSFERLESSQPPVTESFIFPREHTAKPINVFAGCRGTISFLATIKYRYHYDSGGIHPNQHEISSGGTEHHCSFDYVFPANAQSPADLTIGNIIKVREGDKEQHGDPTYSVDLAEWNYDKGASSGPRFLRINPAVSYSTGAQTPPKTSNDEGIGAFMIPIHTHEVIITSTPAEVVRPRGVIITSTPAEVVRPRGVIITSTPAEVVRPSSPAAQLMRKALLGY
jgi:hypothetical protein